ncbi:hypothetical protein FB451DRAFT_1176139 [Mycena latifolia]|nr:hypothetical protein FB451DRAFT_1176139 [Mycena latifolia]
MRNKIPLAGDKDLKANAPEFVVSPRPNRKSNIVPAEIGGYGPIKNFSGAPEAPAKEAVGMLKRRSTCGGRRSESRRKGCLGLRFLEDVRRRGGERERQDKRGRFETLPGADGTEAVPQHLANSTVVLHELVQHASALDIQDKTVERPRPPCPHSVPQCRRNPTRADSLPPFANLPMLKNIIDITGIDTGGIDMGGAGNSPAPSKLDTSDSEKNLPFAWKLSSVNRQIQTSGATNRQRRQRLRALHGWKSSARVMFAVDLVHGWSDG